MGSFSKESGHIVPAAVKTPCPASEHHAREEDEKLRQLIAFGTKLGLELETGIPTSTITTAAPCNVIHGPATCTVVALPPHLPTKLRHRPFMEPAAEPASVAARQRPHTENWEVFNQPAPAGVALQGKPRPSPPHIQTAVTAGFVAHMTPPQTPGSPPPDMDVVPLNQSLFHNYLRALHAFDPATSAMPEEDTSLATLAIRAGDLILVHCIHANGWADGTVLNTGARGWLPTNYCEAYDHAYLRNLLNAMTQFWDLIGAGEDASLSTFVRQDYIRGLIAGVRYLLERADCLHRESPTVKRHTGVRRMRKGLLADLSSLVQIAKRLQDTIGEPFAGEVVHVLLDDLICKAFKVVTRAVSFTDVWTQETGNDSLRLSMYGKPVLEAPLEIDTEKSASKDVAGPIDSAKHLPEPDVVHEAASSHEEQPQDDREGSDEKAPRHSVVFTPPDGVVAHRLSTIITKDKLLTGPGSLASEQLANAHDVCISHIGAFIGHQLHARDASELVATTERLVKACRSMLAIIDEVYSHDPQASLSVQQARNDFKMKIEELAKSTQGVFRFSENPEDDIIMLPGQTDQLINIGTSMISNIGQCVVKTRQLIEHIGDFELKSAGTQTVARSSREIQPEQSMPFPQEPSEQEVKVESRPSIDMKLLLLPPPGAPPPVPEEARTVVDAESPLASPAEARSPAEELNKDLPPLPLSLHRRSMVRASQASSIHGVESLQSPRTFRSDSISPARKDSFGISIAGSTETFFSSTRDSSMTAASQASTRATTPEQSKDSTSPDPAMMNSFASLSSMRSMVTEDSLDVETQLLQKSYAHELTWNKEGQVTGGSLPALVEQLTTHDVAPDPQFVTAFFLTFRIFAEPREFAQALISRFEYIGDSRTVGTPVRLRIYNVFKGWLETHWCAEADKDALGEIRFFALHKLKQVLPTAGDRLIELTRRITEGYSNGTMNGPMVSGVGKISMSISTTQTLNDIPDAIITTRQLNALRLATGGGAQCSIMDFEPVEIARQITLLVAKTYCEIRPEELISMEWSKANTKKAKNVRKMCMLNTDLAHLVADTILSPDSPKTRAAMIKQWIKVGLACLELNNYDSVMSIMCSINSSPVQRLKKTWDLVNKKTKARLDELDKVTDMSKNYNSLRRRLEAPTAPCLPFLGVYLTDLTFVIAGNPKKRHVPGSRSESGEELSVINFDMYMRIAKIISHLQKFQVPYRLKAVPEMQTWMEVHLARMREGHDDMVGTFHRRSLTIEPKDKDGDRKHSMIPGSLGDERPKTSMTSHHSVDRLDFFHRNISFAMKSSSSNLSTPDAEPSKRASAQ
ncbi:hypothetical protein AC578_7233 [Pseudocercospora eumusae]|uniref:Ras-GEF domain-containing protein n=1 Tax=Pseudocercospora eumusae TaxID=321146 RepID=A0A139HWP6_9PEZI|nr:hypothetical protein AC578_7233 [Pseudocercospora eumusae]